LTNFCRSDIVFRLAASEVWGVITGALTNSVRSRDSDISALEPAPRHAGDAWAGGADAAGAAWDRGGQRGAVMRPVYVGASFGWLHTADAATGGEVAVLICPAVSWDRLDAHQALRLLADELALAGYPAMRFDYPSVGDSGELGADAAQSAEPWQGWQQSVHAAIDWLRAATGARRVILCGVRVGATLAALAAARRDDVAALALLAPVLRGRSYIQQLQMEARLQRNATPLPGGDLEFHEVLFDAATIERVAQVDLRQVVLPAGVRVAMFMQAASKPGSECAAAWSGQGAEVSSTGFAGLEPLLRHNEETEGTPPDFSELLGWIRQAAPARPAPLALAAWPEAALTQPGWAETPRRFGDGLFGMLCRPEHAPGDMAVIIGNIGRTPHYGVARFGVECARHLAREGIASLRIDFAGLGDSRGPAGKENVLTSMFDNDRRADLAAAVDELVRLGYRRIVLQGSCSGAYHAVQAALADPRVDTLVLVNLPVFEWHAGDSVDFSSRKTMKPRRYLLKLGNREDWKRLLRGESRVGSAVAAQCLRVWNKLREAALRFAERRGWIAPQSAGRRAVATLAQRGARALFLFSLDDNGVDAMEQEFGRGAAGLRAYKQVRLSIVPEADHLLSTRAMRRAVIEAMARFLADTRSTAADSA
jgi:pimeloyl-ACP methyl ester carboxylesterase